MTEERRQEIIAALEEAIAALRDHDDRYDNFFDEMIALLNIDMPPSCHRLN
jgi:hypothetical protein